ncbi:MAG TPA: beta-eliminating lyase-related protein [Steroidobacteraceae bacterium]|jgi:threonine aldolase|nr:beta-eliminating lyase-related protein [Steroidobacteraceae bacterium]
MSAASDTHAFYSDNTASVAPELLAAIAAANDGAQKAYGDDPWTLQLDAAFSEFFGTPVRAFVVTTGTAANALSLATLSPPYGNVYAHAGAHVVEDECGAVEFFSGGARLTLVPAEHGRIDCEALTEAITQHPANVHTVQPAALTLTQATELGTAYRPQQIAALSVLAHHHGLRVHMDGARLANAIDFLDCQPADVTWRAGVDVLSFGATKNGALAAEAVVFFDPALVRDFELRRKRAGHLLSKSRYAAAQLLTYVRSGLWRTHAQHANRLAQQLAAAAGARLLHPVEANELFLDLGAVGKAALRAQGFGFYDWGPPAGREARFVVSWDQSQRSVDALCQALRAPLPAA